MRSFNMGRFGSDDPWFRVGNLDVNTTIFVVGVGLISMFVWAAEGPGRAISKYLWLASDDLGAFTGGSVLGGQIWRLVTWPIPNEPDFWTLILFAVFFMLGSQIEGAMGRRLFAIYLLIMTVIPAIIVTLYELITGSTGLVAGLRPLELGVLCAFAVRYPMARFWPGVPAWGIAGFLIALELLRDIGNRDSHAIVLLFAILAVSMVALRSMGFAEEAEWIPKVPLPANLGGDARPTNRGASTTKRKRRSRANLSVAPAPVEGTRRELSKLEEAEMDAILDQVSERGMDSLTPQQRSRLEEHAKRLRKRE